MLTQLIIPYCHYWKGEQLMPSSIESRNAQMLWAAEKEICENMHQLVTKDNPRKSLDTAVAMYVGKWSPFKLRTVMREYFTHDHTNEKEVMDML